MADLAVHPAPSAQPPPTTPATEQERPALASALAVAFGHVWARVLGWAPWQQALAAYAVSRLATGIIIALAARWLQNPAGVGDLNPDYLDMVVIWDGHWYQRIVEQGYPSGLPRTELGRVDYNSWAFFPLFPGLVRAVMVTGLPFSIAASLLNLALGAGACVVLWHLFVARTPARQVSRSSGRLAVLAVAIWCLLPPAAVLQIAYTEALAALLLATALLLLVRQRYALAVPVVLLLGLTRAVAAPLLVVIAWHALTRRRSSTPVTPREWRGLGALAAATAVSALLWPAIVGAATGVPTAFFQTQAVWGQEPGKGPFVPWLTWAFVSAGVIGVLLLLGSVAALVSVLRGPHAAWLCGELRVWALAYPLYLLAVVRPSSSMWRFLLLDLPLAAVLASVVARGASLGRPANRAWGRRLAATVLVTVTAMGWWVGTVLTRVPWNGSPP